MQHTCQAADKHRGAERRVETKGRREQKLVGGRNKKEERHKKGVHITVVTHKWEKRIARPWATNLANKNRSDRQGHNTMVDGHAQRDINKVVSGENQYSKEAQHHPNNQSKTERYKTRNRQINKKQRHTTPQTEANTTGNNEKIHNVQQKRTLHMQMKRTNKGNIWQTCGNHCNHKRTKANKQSIGIVQKVNRRKTDSQEIQRLRSTETSKGAHGE